MARVVYGFFLSSALLVEHAYTCEEGAECELPADDMSLLQVGLEHNAGNIVSARRDAATADAMTTKACTGSGVLITGATSFIGKTLYKMLQEQGSCVRAVVRNTDRAKKELGCTKCDASEGIYVADVTKQDSLSEAGKGVSTLVMLASAHAVCPAGKDVNDGNCYYDEGTYPKDIDWLGGINQVTSFKKANSGKPIHVVRLSEMGTTFANSFVDQVGDGFHGFYNLNFEAFLMASGVPYTILKACKMDDSLPGQRELFVGNHDKLFWNFKYEKDDTHPRMSRSDAAQTLFEALNHPDLVVNLRTDVCSTGAAAETDFAKLFQSARVPW